MSSLRHQSGRFRVLALALARQAQVEHPEPPVRFVPHAHLMAMLALAALAIVAELLLPMLRR